MFLLRAKKHFEAKDEQELQEKRENYKQRQRKARQIQAGGRTSSILFRSHEPHTNMDPDELPDGSCFAHKNALVSDSDAEIRQAGYIGTFSVQSSNPSERTDFVHKQLQQMRNSKFHKKVVISISVSGVKVFSPDGSNLLMAHALRRISYASCDPQYRQFSFLAREPQGKVNVQFCHAFVTATSPQAEELNSILGNAFKIALIDKHQEEQLTFNDIIKKQLDDQKATFKEYQIKAQQTLQKNLKTISTPTPFSEKAMEHMERRRSSRPVDDDMFKNKSNKLISNNKESNESVVRRLPTSPFRSFRNLDDLKTRKSSISSKPNLNNNRIRGSPVMALKDSIDRQFESGQQDKYTRSHSVEISRPIAMETRHTHAQSVLIERSTCVGQPIENTYSNSPGQDNYLTPVCNHGDIDTVPCMSHCEIPPSTDDVDSPANKQEHSSVFLANRPLPAIPIDCERPLRIPNQLMKSDTNDNIRKTRRSTAWSTENRRSLAGLPSQCIKQHDVVSRTQSTGDAPIIDFLRSNQDKYQVNRASYGDKLSTCNENQEKNAPSQIKTSDVRSGLERRSSHENCLPSSEIRDDTSPNRVCKHRLSSQNYLDKNCNSNENTAFVGNIRLGSQTSHYDYSTNIGTGQFDNIGTGQFDNILPCSDESLIDTFPRDTPTSSYTSSDVGNDSYESSSDPCLQLRMKNSTLNSDSYESSSDPCLQLHNNNSTMNIEGYESSTDPCVQLRVKNSTINTDSSASSSDSCVQLRVKKSNVNSNKDNINDVNNDAVENNIEEQHDFVPKFDMSNYQIAQPPMYSLDDFPYPDSHLTADGRPKSFPVLDVSLKVMAMSVSSVDAIVTPSRETDNTILSCDMSCDHAGYQNESDSDSGSYEVPLSPDRLDSLRQLDRSYIEDEHLRHCSWYQPGIPREIALEILRGEGVGCFIIRDSTTHPGCYALSVNVPKYNKANGIAHYLVLRTVQGVRFKGLNKDWSSLTALVTHHTVMREMLPCPLRLPHDSHNPAYLAVDKGFIQTEDPDYQKSCDIKSLMASLDDS